MSTQKHFGFAAVIVFSVCISTSHAQPTHVVVENVTITNTVQYVAAASISVGPHVVIAGTGNVSFLTGGSIYLRPGVAVLRGGRLSTIRTSVPSHVESVMGPLIRESFLEPNYPNPFNPTTTIRFAVKEASHVSVVILNLLGQVVATLVDEPLEAGTYETRFRPDGLSSGVYVYRLVTKTFAQSRTMLLMK